MIVMVTIAVGIGVLMIGSNLAQTAFAMWSSTALNRAIQQIITQTNNCSAGGAASTVCSNTATNNVN
jgi:hypothetical protein